MTDMTSSPDDSSSNGPRFDPARQMQLLHIHTKLVDLACRESSVEVKLALFGFAEEVSSLSLRLLALSAEYRQFISENRDFVRETLSGDE